MNRWGFLNLFLALVLAIFCTGIIALRTNPHKRSGDLLEGMVKSPAPGDYSPSTVFANGQTLQDPVPGTLARKPTIQGPVLTASDALDRGKVIYDRNCLVCHGAQGRGDGSVTTKGYPPPPSLLTQRARDFSDQEIIKKIAEGGPMMPPYAAQIAVEDRAHTVRYLRQLQKTHRDKAAPVAAAESSGAAAATAPWTGAEMMAKSDCMACHGVDNKIVGPGFREIAAKYKGGNAAALIEKIKNGGSGAWGAIPMTSHPSLSDAELSAMVDSILALYSKDGAQ